MPRRPSNHKEETFEMVTPEETMEAAKPAEPEPQGEILDLDPLTTKALALYRAIAAELGHDMGRPQPNGPFQAISCSRCGKRTLISVSVQQGQDPMLVSGGAHIWGCQA